MALIYGKFKLDMDDGQFDDLCDLVTTKLLTNCGMAGIDAVPLSKFDKQNPLGVCFIEDRGDIVGMSFKGPTFNRFTIIQRDHEYHMEVDSVTDTICSIFDLKLDMVANLLTHEKDTTLNFTFDKVA